MDEIDKLVRKGDDVLYNLSRINTDLKNSRVSLIGISNDLNFTEFLDPRVRSSLSEIEIVFPPYDTQQIYDILKERAILGFKQGVLDENVLNLCAKYAAGEHGDARRALDLLRVSGEISERSKSPKILSAHVKEALSKIESDRFVEVIQTLPTQSKLVLLSIIFLSYNGTIKTTTGDVYNVYKNLCNILGTDILTQRRIGDLVSELDMLGIINAILINRGGHGRKKEISISVPTNSTKNVLFEDYRLKPLENYNLIRDENSQVRKLAVVTLGSALPYISDKKQTLDDLIFLSKDNNKEISSYANYYLGLASIIKASEAEDNKFFKYELEKAIDFFEKSSKRTNSFNLVDFYLPLYKSFHIIIYNKEESLSQLNKYLIEAKAVLEGSQPKEKLIKSIELLTIGLRKVQNISEKGLNGDINSFQTYYDQIIKILNEIEELEPLATTIIRRGLSIINENIGTELKDQLICRDLVGLEKSLNNLHNLLSISCAKMPEEERSEAYNLLGKMEEEKFIEDKLNILNILISKLKINGKIVEDSSCEE